MSRRSKLTFSPANVTLVGMSGLAVVLNTGAVVDVLLYSLLSCEWLVMDMPISKAAINMILFMRFWVLSSR